MSGKAMSLKAIIRNLAKKKHMSAQVVLQNFMFERFLERLSKSEFSEKFILKGGMLIAALVDISNRSTMDMDVTIKNYPMNTEELTRAIRAICNISLQDDVFFTFTGIGAIRDDDAYGGYRVSLRAEYDTIITPMQIDITTGDAITPTEILYSFKMIFNEGTIGVWTYPIETVIAEKVETILRRGTFNTRPRDFYDVYILTKTQNFEPSIFAAADMLAPIDRDIAVLIHNAGVYNTKKRFTDDDIEEVFQVNYLASFIINQRVKEKLKQQGQARIIYVNSEGHRFAIAGLKLDDLRWERQHYTGLKGYGSAKTAQLLSMIQFSHYFQQSGVTINAMHPGDVRTNMGENNGKIYKFFKHLLINPSARSPQLSAQALYYLGVSHEIEGVSGKFFNFTTEEIPAPHALDSFIAQRLWEKSLEMGGLPSLQTI